MCERSSGDVEVGVSQISSRFGTIPNRRRPVSPAQLVAGSSVHM